MHLALHGADPHESHVATRLYGDPATWQRWECEHAGLMRGVAEYSRLREQQSALRQTSLRLIHRKALFEYLRDKQVRGQTRMRILTHFHPARSYGHAVIAEHGVYLRAAGSYLCSGYIGTGLANDQLFLDAMEAYEKLYAEYFDVYCTTYFPTEGAEGSSAAALLPLLKYQVENCRRAILDPSREMPRFAREQQQRRRSGDTVRLDVSDLRRKLAPSAGR
ncbi:MAG TPA: hypothetical protein VMD03_06585 [Steroidobacteraceae bacterium]|nr:hypothetical protein [Steroidobacteraceae bacterium]